MSVSIRSDAGGTFGALQLGGVDAMRFGDDQSGMPQSFRNKIINGRFEVADYATSQSTSGYGPTNRWINTHSGTTCTTSQQLFTVGQVDVPMTPKYYVRKVVTSAAGASNFSIMYQKIWGVQTLSDGYSVVSFSARADSNRPVAIESVQNFGTGGTPSADVRNYLGTVQLTTTWTTFKIVTQLPSIAGKTLGSNNNDSVALQFWLDAGSDYDLYTNSLGQQSGTFEFADVQWETGSIATPIEALPLAFTQYRCAMYYQKFTLAKSYVFVTYTSNGDTRGKMPYLQPMRITPAVNFSTNTWSIIGVGSTANMANLSLTVNPSSPSTSSVGLACGTEITTATYGSVVAWGAVTTVTITLDAEL